MKLWHILSRIRQSEWTGRVLGLIFLFAVCGYAYHIGTRQRESGVTPDGLYIDPKYLDFGEVWEQKDFKWTSGRGGIDPELRGR